MVKVHGDQFSAKHQKQPNIWLTMKVITDPSKLQGKGKRRTLGQHITHTKTQVGPRPNNILLKDLNNNEGDGV